VTRLAALPIGDSLPSYHPQADGNGQRNKNGVPYPGWRIPPTARRGANQRALPVAAKRAIRVHRADAWLSPTVAVIWVNRRLIEFQDIVEYS
jgi:hypothetical protein